MLPALDLGLDEDAWRGLRRATRNGRSAASWASSASSAARSAVWPGGGTPGSPPERTQLLSPGAPAGGERLRGLWPRRFRPRPRRGSRSSRRPDHATEALLIALRLRQALETPGRRAALVSPDRNLARRVAAELARWGIQADDSAGRPLDQTAPGSFLLLAAHLLVDDASPSVLLAALKHPLAAGGMGQRRLPTLMRGPSSAPLLRGPRPPGGIKGLIALLDERARRSPRASERSCCRLLRDDGAGAAGLRRGRGASGSAARGSSCLRGSPRSRRERARRTSSGRSEAGEAARRFLLAPRRGGAATSARCPASAYPAVLAVLMARESVRPRAPGHPAHRDPGPAREPARAGRPRHPGRPQ